MRTILSLSLVAALAAVDARAHGGSFRGPSGGVPPGQREPSDPEPPPPPPSDPGDPDTPVTPGSDTPPGPDTGHDDGTPSGGAPPAPTPERGPQGRPGGKTKQLTYESWRFWWAYNNGDILNLKSHIYSRGESTSSVIYFARTMDEQNRRDARRPTRVAVQNAVIPALRRCVDRVRDHEDVHGGALVALGKLGYAAHIPMFKDAVWNRYRNPRGRRLDFGNQARESAVLALGLLPDLDEGSKRVVRDICLEAVDDGSLRTRERTWAAVCLGLQKDAAATQPLLDLLEKRYPDDNVPAGILAGIGLIGDASARADCERILVRGTVGNKTVSDRVRAFAAYALAKIGDPKSLAACIEILKSRSAAPAARRSAAIAVGVLGAKTPDERDRERAVSALLRYVRSSRGDASGEHFAIIGLSQIATPKALHALVDLADDGKYGQRPFAALGLATRVFYSDRGRGPKVDADLRERIVSRLAKLSRKFKDADTKAAFLLARGLVKDESAIDELVATVAKRGNAVTRGYACVALGLIGRTERDVKDALRLALSERGEDLRRNAAIGLGLLHDAEAVPALLDELRKAKSFAVQGQLISAIGTIGDAQAIDPLVRILDDRSKPDATRALAAVGLGMIGDLRELPALTRLAKNYNYRASVSDLDELLYIF